jgi:hypothetical protein
MKAIQLLVRRTAKPLSRKSVKQMGLLEALPPLTVKTLISAMTILAQPMASVMIQVKA